MTTADTDAVELHLLKKLGTISANRMLDHVRLLIDLGATDNEIRAELERMTPEWTRAIASAVNRIRPFVEASATMLRP